VDYGWLIFAGTFLVALVWNLFTGGFRGETVRKGARQVKGQLEALYSGAHDVREVRLEKRPRIDIGFYERGRAQLEALGYRYLHDIEDVTVRDATGMPACIRAHAGDHGNTRAGLMHLRVGGWKRAVAGLFRLPRDVRAVEFVTEYADGRYLITSNTKGVGEMPMPPSWEFEKFPPAASIEEVERRHRERVRRLQVVPVRVHTVHDSFEAYARQWMRASDWWHGRGGRMTRNEWAKVVQKESRVSDEVYEEL